MKLTEEWLLKRIDSLERRVDVLEKKKTKSESGGKAVLDAWYQAYKERYGIEPVVNAKVVSHAKAIANRLGKDAPEVAAFYVTLSTNWYVQNGHVLQPLVKDCEKVRTEWATGNKITSTQAKKSDLATHNRDLVKRYLSGNK